MSITFLKSVSILPNLMFEVKLVSQSGSEYYKILPYSSSITCDPNLFLINSITENAHSYLYIIPQLI